MDRTRDQDAPEPEPAREAPGTALLPIYLREMGETPLLEREQEVELARELHEAREGLVQLARKLPAKTRGHLLESSPPAPRRAREWSLAELEAFYERLVRYPGEHGDARVARIALAAKPLKRRLDHARDALILSNLRLVAHIAKKYLNHGISFMDLIQEGNIGLMKAVEKFEHERGNKFSTYAYWWIKQAITRAIADKARTIRIPVHVTEKMKKILRVTAELSETLGRKPHPREIARKLRMPVAKVEEILGVVQDAQSFSDAGPGDETTSLLQFVADPSAPSPFDSALDRELKEKVEATLHVLNAREQEIIKLRFGIGRQAPLTLEDIGRMIKLSRERVRQIEDAALRKIQRARGSRDLHQHHTAR